MEKKDSHFWASQVYTSSQTVVINKRPATNLACGSVRTVSSIWVNRFSVSFISTKLC